MRNVKTLTTPRLNSHNISFLDILQDATLHPYPTGDPSFPSTDSVGSWGNVDLGGSALPAGHELLDAINNDQEMISENRVPLGVMEWQAEAKAMLNPRWTGLRDFAVIPNIEANAGAGYFHSGTLDSVPHRQDIDWEQQRSEIQQAGHAPLGGTVPAYTDICGSMFRPLYHSMALSPAQSDTIQPLENANTTTLLDCTILPCPLPVPTPDVIRKSASKRKRIKTVFSRKRPCLRPSRLSHSEQSALTTNLSSKLSMRTEFAAKATTTNGTKSSKQPSDAYPTEHSRVDWVLAWEQARSRRPNLDNAGIGRDIKILDSERRPMSWPHRNPWRKSLDISVAVLTKGFEKLMTDHGESSV